MYNYHVTLQKGRTDTISLYADSILDVRSIYETLSSAKITNIKKTVYLNPSPSLVDGTNCYRELKMLISNDIRNKLFTVRFLKRFVDKSKLIGLIKSYLSLDSKRITKVQSLVIWQ